MWSVDVQLPVTFVTFPNASCQVWLQLHRFETSMSTSLWDSFFFRARLVKFEHSYTDLKRRCQIICDIRQVRKHVFLSPNHVSWNCFSTCRCQILGGLPHPPKVPLQLLWGLVVCRGYAAGVPRMCRPSPSVPRFSGSLLSSVRKYNNKYKHIIKINKNIIRATIRT